MAPARRRADVFNDRFLRLRSAFSRSPPCDSQRLAVAGSENRLAACAVGASPAAGNRRQDLKHAELADAPAVAASPDPTIRLPMRRPPPDRITVPKSWPAWKPPCFSLASRSRSGDWQSWPD